MSALRRTVGHPARHRTVGWPIALPALFVLLGTAPAALASVAQEQTQGAHTLTDVESGRRSCDQLQTTDFERVGEYVMGRMAGSTGAHESMNTTMARMMGGRGEEQMHVVLGQRFTGCGGRRVSGSFAGMMGAAGMMGGPGQGPARPGGNGFGPGGMMGVRGSAEDGDSDDTDWGAVAIGAVAGVLLGALIATALWRRRPLGGQP